MNVSIKNPQSKILVVEDDQDYLEALCDVLRLEGFEPTGITSVAGYEALHSPESYDLLLLDRNLPDGDGIDILKAHRQVSAVPVVFITCEGRLEDRVDGLDADADYYLVKPVQNDELFAILHRCLRRNHKTIESNCWVFDDVRWTLSDCDNKQITLTKTEKSVLCSFINRPGVAVSRAEIIRNLGKDPDTYDHRRLEVAVRRLRKKIEDNALAGFPLESVYGFGYVLNMTLKVKESG